MDADDPKSIHGRQLFKVAYTAAFLLYLSLFIHYAQSTLQLIRYNAEK